MLAITLPDSFTPDNVRTLALVVAVGAVVLGLLVLRFVQKLVTKLVFTVLLALLAFGAWHYRNDLGDCAKTCKCHVAGVDIKVPRSSLPVGTPLPCPTTTTKPK